MIGLLTNTFLFSGVDHNELKELLTNNPPLTKAFKRGELVYPFDNNASMVGFIVEGKCEIRRERSDGSRVVLNILKESDSFGILSIYSADAFPTQIFATKNCKIIFFTEPQIRTFVNNHSQISANLITFLANRISFLNKKIATFSGCRVEDRLAAFLLCEREAHGSDSFDFNCQKTSEEINSGRASVYRAIASLESDGLILLKSKKINILDLNGLERIVK